MKKWLLAFVLLLSILAFPLVTEASTMPQVKKVTAEVLNVKSEATTSAKTIMKVTKGNLVIVTTNKNGFSKVNANGKIGYVSTKGLGAVSSKPKIVSRTNGMLVKIATSSSAKTLTTLQLKTVVEDFGMVNANYHVVQYGAVIGFAHKDSLKATTPTTKYINGQSVSIFAAANKNSIKKGTLSYGEKVKVHTMLGSWSYVTTASKSGYISNSFLVSMQPIQLQGTKVTYSSIENKIRYSTSLRDNKGNAYTAYFIAVKDFYKKATIDDAWAGVSPGDELYNGHYKIALQLKNAKEVYMQNLSIDSFTYNKTRKLVFTVKGKTTADTDFLAISSVVSSAGEDVRLFYVYDGKLREAEEKYMTLRLKSIGNHLYQLAAYYRVEQTGYVFNTQEFSPITGKFKQTKTYEFLSDSLYQLGVQHAERFNLIEGYYVK